MSDLRQARCSCGRIAPSSSKDLAFFQDMSAGKTDNECVNCNYHLEAHLRKQKTGEKHLSNVCDDFTPRSEGREYDIFYCGHAGWD